MTRENSADYDVVGVGFGPSNLALAIALEERMRNSRSEFFPLFIEQQPKFKWHGGMLLPGADMQICFLKDLVAQRDPTSPFTFVNYLHQKGRLEAFINCRTFYPSRMEFDDYLRWAAKEFEDITVYGESITAVEPVTKGNVVTSLRVCSRSHDGQETVRLARNLVVAVGGAPYIPPVFEGCSNDSRLLHSSSYLTSIHGIDLAGKPAPRVAIIGGGQSAAEVTVDLHGRFPEARIDLIFRGHALKPSDSSPFVNEIFNPEATDFMFQQPPERRDAIVRSFRNTNYAVVDADLLEQLYRLRYLHRVNGEERIGLFPRSEVTDVRATGEGIEIETVDTYGGNRRRCSYDAVILATGYDRESPLPFLEPIREHIQGCEIDRNYRLMTAKSFRPEIYMQGYSEASHGLSDTLLSVLAFRSAEIADSLVLAKSQRDVIAFV
jgi:L-ornithine N5-oxygenase